MAQRIIAGKVGVIEGSIQMGAFQVWLHMTGDKDFAVFRAVCSASTDIPIGKARELWAPTALKEKDEIIRKIEDSYRTRIIEAAIVIKARFQPE